jgi:chaperonin cofactor prefoldin
MYIDNREPGQMYDYLESRIEALKKRISELESENEKLRWEMTSLEPEFAHS